MINIGFLINEGDLKVIINSMLFVKDSDDFGIGLIYMFKLVFMNGSLFVDVNDNGSLDLGEGFVVNGMFI